MRYETRKKIERIRKFILFMFASLRNSKQTIYPANLKSIPAPQVESILVFMHIPKTAGTSLLIILQGICKYLNLEKFRIGVTSHNPPVLISPRWQGAWSNVELLRSRFSGGNGVLSGHFPFGVDLYLSSKCSYITVLRDPIDREISNINHNYQFGYFDQKYSIDYLIDNNQIMDNPQTRLVAGAEYCLYEQCTEEIFEVAKSNLACFYLVGVYESLNDFIALLLALKQWPAVRYRKQRVTRKKLVTSISSNTRMRLESFHHFDIMLHKYAKELWLQKVNECIDMSNVSKSKNVLLNIPWYFEYNQNGIKVVR